MTTCSLKIIFKFVWQWCWGGQQYCVSIFLPGILILKVCSEVSEASCEYVKKWHIEVEWMIHKEYVDIAFCIVSLPILPPARSSILSPCCPHTSTNPFFLFLCPWLLRPIASARSLPFSFSLTYYALYSGCTLIRRLAKKEWANKKDLSSNVCRKRWHRGSFQSLPRDGSINFPSLTHPSAKNSSRHCRVRGLQHCTLWIWQHTLSILLAEVLTPISKWHLRRINNLTAEVPLKCTRFVTQSLDSWPNILWVGKRK